MTNVSKTPGDTSKGLSADHPFKTLVFFSLNLPSNSEIISFLVPGFKPAVSYVTRKLSNTIISLELTRVSPSTNSPLISVVKMY